MMVKVHKAATKLSGSTAAIIKPSFTESGSYAFKCCPILKVSNYSEWVCMCARVSVRVRASVRACVQVCVTSVFVRTNLCILTKSSKPDQKIKIYTERERERRHGLYERMWLNNVPLNIVDPARVHQCVSYSSGSIKPLFHRESQRSLSLS